MRIDPNDFAIALIVVFGLGIILSAIWFKLGAETKDQRHFADEEKFLSGYALARARFQQPRDSRGHFVKR